MFSSRKGGFLTGNLFRVQVFNATVQTLITAFAGSRFPKTWGAILVCFLFFVGQHSNSLTENSDETADPGYYQTMDYGSVIAESIRQDWPEEALARKGLAIRVGGEVAMIFDTDLMRFAAGTVGGWLDISNTAYTSFKGSDIPRIEGRQVFGSSEIAGWANGGSFDGPREKGMGNLPRNWAHYNGYYRHGEQVILSYSVGDTGVLELPGAITHGNEGAISFVRTLLVEASGRSMQTLLFEKKDSWSVVRRDEDGSMVLETGDGALGIRLTDAPEGAKITEEQGRVILYLPPSENMRTIRVMIFEMNSPDDVLFDVFPQQLKDWAVPDLQQWTEGGPARWEEDIAVAGELGGEDSAYVIDNIGIPFDNPWGSRMRLTGLDFFDDGSRAAVSTWNGDVWIVSGIDASLENIHWSRFASGLFYPMGIAIVDEQVHVIERSQLTRLHDLNGNGEADYYENLNNDGVVYPMAHSLGLEVDSQGYFYFFKNGNRVPGDIPLHGALMRVSPDGTTREVYANGFRGSNSMAIGPGDRILTADQEGNWVPVERIDVVRQGGFHGYRPHGGEDLKVGDFETPVAWIPRHINNSSGSMTYAGDSRWGPLAGHWILGSYGQGTLLALLTEEIGDRLQGGVVQMSLDTNTGLMRGRMNPADGQLYKVGMLGWGRAAWDPEQIEDARFMRVRYTGQPANLPAGLHTNPNGITIEFTDPLDPVSASEISNYTAQRWEYIYSERYGSPEMSLERPGQEGRDPVIITDIKLSDDNRSVFLEIDDFRSVIQMKISYELQFENGGKNQDSVYFTVNWVSEDDTAELPEWQQRIIDGYRAPDDIAAAEVQEEEPVFEGQEEPEWYRQGGSIFQSYCSSCHVGGGVAPPMNESEWAAGSHEAFIRIVLHGKRGERGIMAPFSWMEDGEIATLVNYIRTRWYETGEQITASDVEQIRQYTSERTGLWTKEELRELE